MNNNTYDLHLKGYVGGCDFDADYVDYMVDKHKDKPLNVLIDSLGGSLKSAMSIAAAFRRHGNVTVHFVGLNASAATIASLGAKHVSMDTHAMYLAHKCSLGVDVWSYLNADDMQQLIEKLSADKSDLDKLDANVASMYAAKCKRTPAELLELMKVGGWLTSKEAKDWGFVDEITNLEQQAPEITDAVASAMVSAGIPIPEIYSGNVGTRSDLSLVDKIIAGISSIFNSKQHHSQKNSTTPMKLILPFILAIIGLEELEVVDGKVTLSEEQINAIEDELKRLNDENAALKEELEKLKGEPADESSLVIESSKSSKEQSPYADYCDSYNAARTLYDLV